MRLKLSLFDAYRGIFTQPLKSMITLISMIVGVAALVALLNLQALASWHIQDALKAMGTKSFLSMVFPHQEKRKSLTLNNLDLFYKSSHDLHLYPFTTKMAYVQTHDASLHQLIVGVHPELLSAFHWLPSEQGFKSTVEPMTMILGQQAARTLKLKVGDQVFIGAIGYKIIGVLPFIPTSPIMDFDVNRSAFVNLEKMISPLQALDSFLIIFRNHSLSQAESIFKTILQKNFGDYEVFFRDEAFYAQSVEHSMASYKLVLSWGAALALGLGVFGIMTQQWLSFLDRRGECGMRLSIGATRLDLFKLFLMESLLLGGIGAVLGALLGVGVFAIIAYQLGWTFYINSLKTLLGICVGTLICGLSGVLPATIAARSQPTKLLAYE